jgi:hypothetical protein
MQLDEILFPLETELPDLGPRKGVDLGRVLEDEHAHVRHRQVQGHSLVILEAYIVFLRQGGPGIDVMITNFGGKKWRFLLKTNVMIQILLKLAVCSLYQKRQFWRQIFWRKYF